jgi:hypothetical protein
MTILLPCVGAARREAVLAKTILKIIQPKKLISGLINAG